MIGQNVIGFDMLTELGGGDGSADLQLIWNILGFMALTDAMDSFARKKNSCSNYRQDRKRTA